MHCDVDGKRRIDSADWSDDAIWGLVHQTKERGWHTVTGTLLMEVEGVLIPQTSSRGPNGTGVPALPRLPSLPARQDVGHG